MNEDTEWGPPVLPGVVTEYSNSEGEDQERVSLKDAADIIKAYTDQNDLTPEQFDDLHEAWSIAEYYHNRPPADPDGDGNPNATGDS